LKHTKHTNVLRRVRALEEARYLDRAGSRKILADYESPTYGLSVRAFAVLILDRISLDDFIENAEENELLGIWLP
jgi:hypothetical protein